VPQNGSMEKYLNWKVGLVVALALFSFAEGYYVRNHASEAVKAMCAREPVDFLYKNQYSDCLRRNM
jgi:hypothetical protein